VTNSNLGHIPVAPVVSEILQKMPVLHTPISFIGTNLIHDFTDVTFSVKLAFFREKCPFPSNSMKSVIFREF